MSRIRVSPAMAVFFASMVCFPQRSQSDIAVDGDAGLLRAIRDAQVTNAAEFKRGEMRCRIHDRMADMDINTSIIWDGDKAFWEYKLSEPAGDPRAAKTGKARRSETGRFIDDGNVISYYFPDSKFAQIITDRSAAYRSQFKVRPNELWFKLEGVYLWSSLLDPDRTSDLLKYVVREEPDDRIVIDYCNLKNGEIIKVVASLAQGGNIIGYETAAHTKDPKETGAFWRRGKYEWERYGPDRWYLKHFEYQRSSTGSPKELHFDFVLDVESFTPNPQIPPDRFESASLMVAQGTVVEQTGKSARTYRVGDAHRISKEELDRLAEKLRQGRFVRP